jgi:hypothetical protein
MRRTDCQHRLVVAIWMRVGQADMFRPHGPCREPLATRIRREWVVDIPGSVQMGTARTTRAVADSAPEGTRSTRRASTGARTYTYQTVGTFPSHDVDPAATSTGVVGARVHGDGAENLGYKQDRVTALLGSAAGRKSKKNQERSEVKAIMKIVEMIMRRRKKE